MHGGDDILTLTTVRSGHDIAVRWGPGDHGRNKGHRVLRPSAHVWENPPSLVSAVIVISVPCLLSAVVEVVWVDGARLHLGEPGVLLHMVCSVVQIRHGGHGVHGSRHGRGRDGFRFLDTGVRDLICTRVVIGDLGKNKRPVHVSCDLLLTLLGESLIAVAAAGWVAGVVTAAPVLLMLHVSYKRSFARGDEGKAR